MNAITFMTSDEVLLVRTYECTGPETDDTKVQVIRSCFARSLAVSAATLP